MAEEGEITNILKASRNGDADASEKLAPLIYAELRRLASASLRDEKQPRTLQTTDLVHDVWLRLCGADHGWENRVHFFRVAARTMRRLIVDHARARRAEKRGGARSQTALDALARNYEQRAWDLVGLDDALQQLHSMDPQKTELVELRFFGGLQMAEVASVLGLSLATAEREWKAARAWLAKLMKSA